MSNKLLIIVLLLIWVVLSSCSGSAVSSTPGEIFPSPTVQVTVEPLPAEFSYSKLSPTPLVEITGNPTITPYPENSPTPVLQGTFVDPTSSLHTQPDQFISWQDLPVLSEISPRVITIYQRGIDLGNNPKAFSKIGDCGSTPAWFLGDFDRGPRFYRLGEHQYLEGVIETFQGSFGRTSLAAKSGFNVSSIFSPLWSNREFCNSNESPLACEYRVHRPIAAFIMLGTNDVYHPAEFEPQMRKIIEYSIEQGVIPILSTKADNLEGDNSINATIARLALEYEIPLINYWRALQELPDQGLQEDKAHITWGPNRFDDPKVMQRGWPIRNLTALQMLDELMKAIQSQNNP